ncbi:MAG: hypothetical protein IKO90_10945 [Bacteroidales bacterium]|nr:hypothetical protein [Bacteroidales bacterium]
MNLRLSEETINKNSPYKVSLDSHNEIIFTTDNGCNMRVGFTDDYMISERGVFQFFIINQLKTPSLRDAKLRATIQLIFECFFEEKNRVAVYICDSMDGKQHIRNRLFQMWFNSYLHKEKYTLQTATIDFDGISYYSAMLIHKDNADYEVYLQLYQRFIEQLTEKL